MECLKNFQSNQEAEKSKDPPVKGIQLEKPKPGEEPSDCESLSASDSEEDDPLSSRKPRHCCGINQQRTGLNYSWTQTRLPLATTGYHGLLRPSTPQFTKPHPTTWPDTIRTTYSSTQTHTGKHHRMSRAGSAQQHCCKACGLSLMRQALDQARRGPSPPRPRLTAATAR